MNTWGICMIAFINCQCIVKAELTHEQIRTNKKIQNRCQYGFHETLSIYLFHDNSIINHLLKLTTSKPPTAFFTIYLNILYEVNIF